MIETFKLSLLDHVAIVVAISGALTINAVTNFARAQDTSPNWARNPASEYPLRVSALRFSNGVALNSTIAVRFGNWDVIFSRTAAPVAVLGDRFERGYVRYTRVEISPLTCRNEVVGEQNCYMEFLFNDGIVQPHVKDLTCKTFVGTTPAESVTPMAEFEIECPNIVP